MELSGMNGALFVSITAFTVVIVILGAMALFMHALGWTVTKANGIARNRPRTAHTQAPAAAAPSDGVDDETVAAVTAAVTMMMGDSRFHVTGITPVADQRPGWVVSGPGNVPDSSDRWRR